MEMLAGHGAVPESSRQYHKLFPTHARSCGFASTNLDFILRQRGIENVALGGFLTNW